MPEDFFVEQKYFGRIIYSFAFGFILLALFASVFNLKNGVFKYGSKLVLGSPVLIFPAEGRAKDSHKNFLWSEVRGARRYDIEIANYLDAAFAAPVVKQSLMVTSLQSTPKLKDGRYIWRVRALAHETAGPWSIVSEFRISSGPPPVLTRKTVKPRASTSSSSCAQSVNIWRNIPISPQKGNFILEFDAQASPGADVPMGLSYGAASSYSDLAVIPRFNASGTIDARNGSVYSATIGFPFVPGEIYHFRIPVDVVNHTYSVYVRAAGESEKNVAYNYFFRSERSGQSEFNNFGFMADIGSGSVCKVKATGTFTPPRPFATPKPASKTGNVLFSDDFNKADKLIINEFAFWNPGNADAAQSEKWEMTSGSFFAGDNVGWSGNPDDKTPTSDSCGGSCNNSAIYRLTTKRADFGDVAVKFKLLNQGLGATAKTPAVDWDGVHVFLRYQSEYSLYYASINRRDNKVVIKKKVPSGASNGGTYYTLTSYNAYAVPFNVWQDVEADIQNSIDGTVSIRLYVSGNLVASAIDNGVGGPPIITPGKVGIRGDNANFKIDDFMVSAI